MTNDHKRHLVLVALGLGACLSGCDTPAIDEPSGYAGSRQEVGTLQQGMPLDVMFANHSATSGDWLITRAASEGTPAYTQGGAEFQVIRDYNILPPPTGSPNHCKFSFQDLATGKAPPNTTLSRCRDQQGFHYQSISDCNDFPGSTREDVLGLIFTVDPGDGARPIYRCAASNGVKISTPNVDNCLKSGLAVQAVLGWAYPYPFTGGT